MGLGENILFAVSKRQVARAAVPGAADKGGLSQAGYDDWRDRELSGHLCENFDLKDVKGKCVLDFGCGCGALAFHLLGHGAAGVVGVDLSQQSIDEARKQARMRGIENAAFHVAKDPRRIEFEERSFDLICCFDVLEHVMFLEEIASQWRRLLRPQGQVWIWWSPWRSPYGHHLTSLVPVPWAHVLCSERTVVNVASRVYDDPCFVPRGWHIDSQTGEKLPNKWKMGADLASGLNKLTLSQFKATCKSLHFGVEIRPHGFSSNSVKRLLGWMAHVPGLGEYFTSYYTIILHKGDDR